MDSEKDIHNFDDSEYCHKENYQYFNKGVIALYPADTSLKK